MRPAWLPARWSWSRSAHGVLLQTAGPSGNQHQEAWVWAPEAQPFAGWEVLELFPHLKHDNDARATHVAAHCKGSEEISDVGACLPTPRSLPRGDTCQDAAGPSGAPRRVLTCSWPEGM